MEAKEEKKTPKKITRRDALKRIALTTGSIGLLGSLHSWATTKSGVGLEDMIPPEQKVVAYSSYRDYNSYQRIYSSGYVSYGSQYSSYRSSAYSSYVSLAPGQSRGGGCTRSD